MTSRFSDPNAASPGGQQGGGVTGRRPQVCPSWMNKEEFEVCRNDPYRAFDITQSKIAELQQRVAVAKKLNTALLQDPQYQFGQAVQNFDKLKQEHIQLNDGYNDLESINETLQEVIEVLRGDKHQLLVELNALNRESTIQDIENAQLKQCTGEMTAFLESLDLKLRSQEQQLAQLDDDIRESAKQATELNNEISALESTSHNLSLQSTSLSDLRQHLDTTRVAQDRAIQSMEREVQAKAQEIVQHDAQLWDFKREMSGRILALQKKAQECFDELGRLHRLSEHELGTLAAQNRALNDELKSTADALFATRKEKTDFNTSARREINTRKEEVQQCLSILDLIERQNAGLEASISRLISQNKASEKQIVQKDNVNHKSLIEQANFISMVHMELQTTREDLYLLKARLCHHCRETILEDEALEDRATARQALPAMPPMPQPLSKSAMDAGDTPGPQKHSAASPSNAGGGQTRGGDDSALQSVFDPEKARLDAELRRAKEALETLNRQLLDERSQRDRERREEEEQRQQEEEEKVAKQMEEEAHRRRSKEDDRKLAAGEEAQTWTVRFVDNTVKKVDAFRSDTVQDVIGRVCAKVGIRQIDLMYLANRVNENSVLGPVDRFLDRAKTLEQEGLQPKNILVLKFKHYKRHRRWVDTVAQNWFFRQIHNCVCDDGEYYPVSEKLAVELASYEIQAVFGDYSGRKRHSYFDRVGVDSYLPPTVSEHRKQYWQERLFALHKQRKGQSPIQAINRYIEIFSHKSPYWGLTFFDIRDRENRPFLAGIGEDGMYILSANKRQILQTLRFEHLMGWEKSATGIFVKKRGNSKMTLFASSKLQSKEMVDLLNEYYMMLPQEVRDRCGITIEQAEEVRASVPPPDSFEPPVINRRKAVEFTSQLEYMKAAYMQDCMQRGDDTAIVKFARALDTAIDNDVNLEVLDLSESAVPVTDMKWAILHDLFLHTLEYTPDDLEQWRKNVQLQALNLAQTRERQALSEHCVPNVCNFLRTFKRINSVNLSYIPLDNRNEADVAAALTQLEDLQTLVLRGCKIGTKGLISLLRVFSVVPSRLKVLDVGENEINHAGLTQLCAVMDGENCSLTSLDIGFNKVEIVGLEALIQTLKRKRRLQVLNFGGNPSTGAQFVAKYAELIAAGVGITDLDISHSLITGDSGVRVSTELKAKGEIKKLNMADNPIGQTLVRTTQGRDYPAEFFAFLDVGSWCSVTSLNMDRCQLHEEAGQALANVLHNNSKLNELFVTNNQLASKTGHLAGAWTDMLPVNQYLTKLHLSYNGISYQGLAKLFAALTRNRSIADIKLDGNLLDRYPPNAPHTEITTFVENNSSCTYLSLCDTYMKDDLLIRIGDGLRRNRALRKIEAHNNELTVRGVGELARRLGENNTLEYLDISCRSVQVSDELYEQAYKQLINSSNLETVLL